MSIRHATNAQLVIVYEDGAEYSLSNWIVHMQGVRTPGIMCGHSCYIEIRKALSYWLFMRELSRRVKLITFTAILLASSLSMVQTRFNSLTPILTASAVSLIQSPSNPSGIQASSNGILIDGNPVPRMPVNVGCYEYTNAAWLSMACVSPEQAAGISKPTEGGNSGVIGVASNVGVLSYGYVKVTFSQFSGELDTTNYQCDSFSIQTNTNFFGGNNGHTDWVQFVEQSVNCALIFAHFCIWQIDVTAGQYPNKCVFTNIQGLSSSYYASSYGYLSQSGGVNYLNGIFCDNSNTCWGVVDTDNNGLTGRWFDTTGTILGYGGGGTAQFGSPANLSTYVYTSSSSYFTGGTTNIVVTGEMNNLYPYPTTLSCGSAGDRYGTTYYCDTTTSSSTSPPCGCSCYCGGSVAPGTLITMKDGSQVSVQNLRAGMQLLSYDLISHQYVTSTITRLATVETHNQMVISTGTGKPLIVDQNPVQKLYVRQSDGTVTLDPVTDLKVGNQVFDALSQTWVPITGISYQNEGAHLMYDISCTVPGNYIANGYLVPDK